MITTIKRTKATGKKRMMKAKNGECVGVWPAWNSVTIDGKNRVIG